MTKKTSLFGRILHLLKAPESIPPKHTITFEPVPDGKYLVRFVDERILTNEYILCVFEIVYGEYKDRPVPMVFDDAAAKRTMQERIAGWVTHLGHWEENKQALLIDLYRKEPEIVATIKEGHIKRIYEPDSEQIDRVKRKPRPHK